MPDPFAHGMPAGDYHSWVKPPSPNCPDCECCTSALCSRATSGGVPCWVLVNGRPTDGVMDVSGCQCTAQTAVSSG